MADLFDGGEDADVSGVVDGLEHGLAAPTPVQVDDGWPQGVSKLPGPVLHVPPAPSRIEDFLDLPGDSGQLGFTLQQFP